LFKQEEFKAAVRKYQQQNEPDVFDETIMVNITVKSNLLTREVLELTP
jgi:hypothetical protein